MSADLLEKVIKEVRSLTPEEQLKVREMLDSILTPKKNPPTREEYEKHLLAKGVISHLPTRRPPSIERKAFKPVTVEGKPLSEIIIEERR